MFKGIGLIITNLEQLWIKLTGDSNEFSLERRIFHAICIICMSILITTVPLNLINGMAELALLMALLLLATGFFFYLSRFRNKLTVSIFIFGLFSNILFVTNFYFNSGISGPTLQFLMLFLTLAIVPKKQYLFWIVLNISLVSTLLIVSYKYPTFIDYAYPSSLSRYRDLGYSYILVASLIFLVTHYIRNSYNKEKLLTEQKARELHVANETKNKLLSILAHDLKSPLSSIRNYLEILSEFDINENEKHVIRASLLTETKNTQLLLSNLLSWSKAQMEGVVVNLCEVNLKQTLIPALSTHQTMAAEKCIQLEDEINDSIYVLADSDMLQLVVRNLVNNAIKFTASGGRISLTSKISNDRCLINIADNGSGIPYDLQGDLFSLKARSTFGTQNEKGAGLGLALCKEFTDLQKGEIWFNSEPGVGTTFYLSLILRSSVSESESAVKHSFKRNKSDPFLQ